MSLIHYLLREFEFTQVLLSNFDKKICYFISFLINEKYLMISKIIRKIWKLSNIFQKIDGKNVFKRSAFPTKMINYILTFLQIIDCSDNRLKFNMLNGNKCHDILYYLKDFLYSIYNKIQFDVL